MIHNYLEALAAMAYATGRINGDTLVLECPYYHVKFVVSYDEIIVITDGGQKLGATNIVGTRQGRHDCAPEVANFLASVADAVNKHRINWVPDKAA